MDKYAKDVYNFVLSQPDHSFIYQMYPDQIPGGIDMFQDFKAACRYLADQGYAVISSSGMVTITHVGVHKRELELIDFHKKLLTHFIPGFILGILATVIAEALGAYILSILGL